MKLEAGKEMYRRCVWGWLNEVYRNPTVAYNTYSDEQQIEFAHDALVLLKEHDKTVNDLTDTIRQLNQHIKDLSEYMTPYGKVEDVKAYAELLKEQKAELSYREAKAITHTATKLDDATCPSCGNVVGEKIRTGAIGQSVVQVRWDYCRFCGQKLDWEGR